MQNALEQACIRLELQRQLTERRIHQVENTIKEFGATWEGLSNRVCKRNRL